MTPKFPILKSRQVIRALKKAGFYIHHQTGSHLQLKHNTKQHLRVTVPIHGKDLKIGVLKAILKQAELTIEELNEYL